MATVGYATQGRTQHSPTNCVIVIYTILYCIIIPTSRLYKLEINERASIRRLAVALLDCHFIPG